jgi:hypothetical protein
MAISPPASLRAHPQEVSNPAQQASSNDSHNPAIGPSAGPSARHSVQALDALPRATPSPSSAAARPRRSLESLPSGGGKAVRSSSSQHSFSDEFHSARLSFASSSTDPEGYMTAHGDPAAASSVSRTSTANSGIEEIDVSESSQPEQPPGFFTRFLQGTDIYNAMRQGDTAAFLDQLREGGAQGTLGQMLGNLREMEAEIEGTQHHEVPVAIRDSLKASLGQVRKSLESLQKDHSLPQRLLAAAATTMIGAAPLALVVPWKLNQLKYLALQIAFYAKTAAYTAGAVANPNADKSTWTNILIERHALTGSQALLYAAPAFAQSHTVQELREKLTFNLGATAAAISVLASSYYKDDIGNLLLKLKGKLGGTTPFNASELREEARQTVSDVLQRAQADEPVLKQAQSNFDGFVNDATNRKISDVADQYGRLIERLTALGQTGQPPQERERPPNPDVVAKTALAVLTGVATGVTTALILPDYAGVVDFAADAVFVTALMALTAKDSQESLQGALAKFQNFVGLSLTALPILAIDKFKPFFNPLPHGTPVEGIAEATKIAAENIGTAGFIGGAVGLTLANLTLPGHAGKLAADMTQGLVNCFRGPQEAHDVEQPPGRRTGASGP